MPTTQRSLYAYSIHGRGRSGQWKLASPYLAK